MKLSTNHKTSKKGFTLVELLVVIAIIAGLAGVSYGPLMRYLTNADVMKSSKVCKDLVMAINTYETEYDSLPYTDDGYPASDATTTTDSSEFLEVIMGINIEINDRGKEFFTADQAKGTKDGLVYSGANVESLLDKWGNGYTIMLDYDSDGKLDATQIGSGSGVNTSYKTDLHVQDAIAAAPGPDKEYNDEQDAKSW